MRFTRPPLYYVMGALFLRLTAPTDVTGEMLALRLLSVAMTVAMALGVWAAAAAMWPTRPDLWLLAGVFAGFLPQIGVIGATVNSDNLANLFAAWMIALSVVMLTRGSNARRWIVLFLLFVFAAFTSRLPLLLAPALAAVGFIGVVRRGFRLTKIMGGLVFGLGMGVIIWIAASWFWPEAVFRVVFSSSRALAVSFQRLDLFGQVQPWSWWLDFFRVLIRSFILQYGWMEYVLPRPLYLAWAVVPAWSAIGWIAWRFKRRPGQAMGVVPTWWLLMTPVVCATACVVFIGMRPELAQGRYLFPGLACLALLVSHGAAGWGDGLRARQIVLASAAFLVLFDLLCLVGFIVPTYGG